MQLLFTIILRRRATLMGLLHDRHPETDIQFTEHSEWGVAGMAAIQSYFLNWSRSYVYWVTMTTKQLDEHNQSPYNRIGELSPTLLIEREPGGPEWYVTPEYYLLGQFSKFIRAGARRIACPQGSPEKLTFVAFRNPEGSVVVVAVNQTAGSQPVTLQFREQTVSASIPAKTVATFVWPD